MLKTTLLLTCLFLTGCNYLAVKFTPDEVKKSIAIGAAISQLSVDDPPVEQNLEDYLKANAELWDALAQYFGVKENE